MASVLARLFVLVQLPHDSPCWGYFGDKAGGKSQVLGLALT